MRGKVKWVCVLPALCVNYRHMKLYDTPREAFMVYRRCIDW